MNRRGADVADVQHVNITQAASTAGYSPSRAKATGLELARNRKVVEEIEKHCAKTEADVQITVEGHPRPESRREWS